jgi:signal transduction histidine kinase
VRNQSNGKNKSAQRPGRGGSIKESIGADTVLIVSDDPDFARTIVARWQGERMVPAFTLLGSRLPGGATSADYSLAILGPSIVRQSALVQALEASGAALLCVTTESETVGLRSAHPRALFVRQLDGWLDVVVQLGAELLRRSQAVRRMQRAEQSLAESARHATLGRYILEMRHALNNCLTSLLGNAELLLLEPGRLNIDTREQIQTIHTMALRMHEILQRFSSLESELQFAERESHSETEAASQAAGAEG